MSCIANKSESTLITATDVIFHENDQLQQLIVDAKAISFDFFDTLFVRPLVSPENVFDILERQFSIPNFRRYRLAAQTEAFRLMNLAGRKEISLKDIYACLEETGVPNDELMHAEYALELALIEPNPDMFVLFRSLLEHGKLIVITSDMYLSAAFFKDALRPHGITDVPLFISVDCNATKRDHGELFDIVSTELGLSANTILHIGDSLLADIERAREKGFKTFHYRPSHGLVEKTVSLSASMTHGMLRTSACHIPTNSYTELGFLYGGPAHVGFLKWVTERAKLDRINHVLFVSRDGYALERIANADKNIDLPSHCYFLGSRVAYTLAAMNELNFSQFIPFLLSGGIGLRPSELLERIGVPVPSLAVMNDLGLGPDIRVNVALHERLASFMYAYRWEILKICRRNRRALYLYLKQIGITPGSRVALVDVGWSGTTQEAFEMAVHPIMDLQVYGYYFCLADTPEYLRRNQTHRMAAMINSATTSTDIIAKIYTNRVTLELFFSAPHYSVIGLEEGKHGVEAVFDAGRGNGGNLARIAEDVVQGIEEFAAHYRDFQARVPVPSSPIQICWPLIELVIDSHGSMPDLFNQVKNFDTWASSGNHEIGLVDYIKKDFL